MEKLIEIFRMRQLPAETRIKIIKKLGLALNDEHGRNITGELVEELVKAIKKEPKIEAFVIYGEPTNHDRLNEALKRKN